jgi:single-strand DNA-binding protein
MSSVNKVILVGRLGRDPEMRSGVCKLSVATDYKPRDGEPKTEWHRVTCFGKTAELAEKYLAKGRQVYIEGRLQTSSYEKDGEKRYSTEIVVHDLKFLGSKSDGAGSSGPAPYDDSAPYSPAAGDDDVPF